MKYFDYAATTPMCKEALDIYLQTNVEYFGNSASLHDTGSLAQQLLTRCRQVLARLIGCEEEGLYFTSGGTESNLLAIISLARKAGSRGNHIITSMAEHTSVHSAMSFLENEGFEVTRLPLNKQGIITAEAVHAVLRKDTVLVSIQYVNQEIGTIQPIKAISAVLHQKKIMFHCDCVQAFGKLDLRPLLPYIDSLSVSAHKIYGPKGVGAVFLSPRIPFEPVFPGLTHENGFRGGTVNVPGIASLTAAAERLCNNWSLQKDYSLRRRFIEQINGTSCIIIEGKKEQQLPSIIGLRIPGMEAQLVMLKANEAGCAISTGSACQSSSESGTKAVLSMGVSMEEAKQFFRISFGDNTRIEEVDYLSGVIRELSVKSAVRK